MNNDPVFELWGYNCADCGGLSISPFAARPLGSIPCIQCGQDAQFVRVTNELPEWDLEVLAQQQIDADKARPRRSPTALKCPFCDAGVQRGSNSSREHVLAQWIRAVPPMPEAIAARSGGQWRWAEPSMEFANGTLLVRPPRRHKSKAEHPAFVTVAFCERCNNGWMSRLEKQTEPVLAPLISGTSTSISVDDCRILAHWMGKVWIAFEQDDLPTAKATAAQIRDVKNGRPPRSTELWIVSWGEPLTTQLAHKGSQAIVPELNISDLYTQTRTYVSLGHIGMALLAVNKPELGPDLTLLPHPWQRIWPKPEGDVQLPQESLSRADLDAFEASLSRSSTL